MKPLLELTSKRKFLLSFLLPLLLVLIGLEFYLFKLSHSLPFIHSIFFFGLINFNVFLFLFLLFLIFKKIIRNLSKSEGGNIGTSLKNKLIAAFLGFSFIPTVLMFLIFIFYINTSFDKWFSAEMKEVLKSSLEVNKNYVVESKKKNYHFGALISKSLQSASSLKDLKKMLSALRQKYNLDVLEYESANGEKFSFTSQNSSFTKIPEIPSKFKERSLSQGIENSMVQTFQKGNLVRVLLPIDEPIFQEEKISGTNKKGILLISSFVPFALLSKIENITSAYESLRQSHFLEIPLKSIYLTILILMTLVIFLSATWFGFFLAKQLSVPLELLGQATQKLAHGEYKTITAPAGSKEIHQLIEDFNSMTKKLEKAQGETKKAHQNLKHILKKLNEHNDHMKVILTHISAGVISTNAKNEITTVNPYAIQLLNFSQKEQKLLGQDINKIFSQKIYAPIREFLETFKDKKMKKEERDIEIQLPHQSIPINMTLSSLQNSEEQNLGRVLVLHDLTLFVSAQRAQAWKEVAKKIAHEIKNPLTPIKLAAQRLQNKFEKKIGDDSFDHCISMIIDQVDSIKSLVNEFSYFSRLPKSKPSCTSLNRVIEDVFILFREAHKSLQWNWIPDETIGPFLFDSAQIKRVITNLLDNAVNAVKKIPHGEIKVITQHTIPYKTVRIVVEDNGKGIPTHLRNRVFEPYVTTHGTGLGLAIAKRSVEEHHGSLHFYPVQKGKGTQMVIDLPMIVPSPVISIAERIPSKPPKEIVPF